jgi:hypothetical protein
MSQARTVWHEVAARRNAAKRQYFTVYLFAFLLLITMTVAEVQFLRHFAGPDSVNMMAAAEGIPTQQ